MKRFLSILALLSVTQLIYGQSVNPHPKALKFKPTNDLEILFLESSTNDVLRIQFWETLMDSEVFVLGDVEQGTNAILDTWTSSNDEASGVFTSADKINGAMPKGTKYIRLKARVIFQSMKDENLGTFINPRYEAAIRLHVDDLEFLLEGEYAQVKGEIP